MKTEGSSLYYLSPDEFEKLCAEILKALGFTRVEIVGGPGDQGVDVIGEAEGQQVAVQVIHAKKLATPQVRKIIDRIKASPYKPEQIIVMSSAAFTPEQKDIIQNIYKNVSIKLIGQSEILEVLDTSPGIRHLYLAPVQRRNASERTKVIFSVLGILLSVAVSYSIYFINYGQTEKQPLQERIEAVEDAMISLKGLEKQLVEIKGDMIETERARKVIMTEYAKAVELKKLTHEQFDALKSALRLKYWWQTAIDYLIGFVIGIASSLLATIIYARIRRRRVWRDGRRAVGQ